MHGNTKTSAAHAGVKTRHMHDIVYEISANMRIHAQMGSRLGGVHLELTGDMTKDGQSVTECLGGSMQLEEEHLGLRFESFCDREPTAATFSLVQLADMLFRYSTTQL